MASGCKVLTTDSHTHTPAHLRGEWQVVHLYRLGVNSACRDWSTYVVVLCKPSATLGHTICVFTDSRRQAAVFQRLSDLKPLDIVSMEPLPGNQFADQFAVRKHTGYDSTASASKLRAR